MKERQTPFIVVAGLTAQGIKDFGCQLDCVGRYTMRETGEVITEPSHVEFLSKNTPLEDLFNHASMRLSQTVFPHIADETQESVLVVDQDSNAHLVICKEQDTYESVPIGQWRKVRKCDVIGKDHTVINNKDYYICV